MDGPEPETTPFQAASVQMGKFQRVSRPFGSHEKELRKRQTQMVHV
jgi:hypothetical protein